MKIVHVNNTDLPGARFNGHDVQIALNKKGISCKQFVMEKLGDNPNTIPLIRDYEEPFLSNLCTFAETELSMHAMFYPYGWRLLQHRNFQQADIAHYHLLHNYFISYAMFPELTKTKLAVLTIHDPWLFTGHCIYPIHCTKWERTKCHNCPNLERIFPMKKDNASYMWELKRTIFSNIELDLVVASKWMLDLVKRSPITAHFKNVHLIPFGIDTDVFHNKREKTAIRNKLGIPQNHVVLFFRSEKSPVKGLKYILQMLKMLPSFDNLTLLTVGSKGLLQRGSYKLVEQGWVNDEAFLAELYAASDIFLMPSVAEAFGVMAIEAMSSGLPIVVLDGTSLPDVTFAPECGLVVENYDTTAFAKIVEHLIQNPEERQRRGERGRLLALKHYKVQDHFQKLIGLYHEILSRKSCKSR